MSWSTRSAVDSILLSNELCRRAYSSTASASGSETLPCPLARSSGGTSGPVLAGEETGELSGCSCDACIDSCLDVKMCQGPSKKRRGGGRCSAGCARGAGEALGRGRCRKLFCSCQCCGFHAAQGQGAGLGCGEGCRARKQAWAAQRKQSRVRA